MLTECAILQELPKLTELLSRPQSKLKFLQATEALIEDSGGRSFCRPGSRMLDVGAGNGEFTRWLSARCSLCARAYDVNTIDNANSLLRGRNPTVRALARNHSRDLIVHHFDGERLPEPDGAFDLVVFSSTLHHAAGRSCSLLAEARRVLTDGDATLGGAGHVLIFEDLAIPSDAAVAHRHFVHDAKGIFRTRRSWHKMLIAAGFRLRGETAVGSRNLSLAVGLSRDQARMNSGWAARLDYRHQHALWFQADLPRTARAVSEARCRAHPRQEETDQVLWGIVEP